jgi:hypothetical protein
MNLKIKLQISMAVILLSGYYLSGQTISVQSESGLNITFGGEVEMEFVDVEGPGGFTNQDLTYQKVDIRSPHMRIDKAILSTRIDYSENLYYKFELRFGDKKANVDKHYARLTLPSLGTRLEIGKNKPMIATKRHTEGYPLIGTAFWKGREYHITSETELDIMENINLELGLSFAMKRPIGSDDAAEDKSFKMMVYGDYDDKDGQTFEYGGMFGLKAFGLSAKGWYYTGALMDDFDWKYALGGLPGYDDIADAYNDGVMSDLTHWWYGGRAGFDRGDIHLSAEFIKAQDGLLPRDGYYVEGSYRMNYFRFLPVQYIEPVIRYGKLNMERHPPQLADPETWDRTMTTIAILAPFNEFVLIKCEYYILDEVTGGSNPEDKFVEDDQFLIQIRYEF